MKWLFNIETSIHADWLLLVSINETSHAICLHRDVWIASCDRVIQNESRYPFGGNVYHVTMRITSLTTDLYITGLETQIWLAVVGWSRRNEDVHYVTGWRNDLRFAGHAHAVRFKQPEVWSVIYCSVPGYFIFVYDIRGCGPVITVA